MKKTNPLISDDSVNAILEIATAYQKSKILLTACELDLFTHLGSEAKTAKEIAIATDTHERSIERLMNALSAIRLLEKKGNRFTNTKGTRRFLVHGQPEFIGDMTHISHLWNTWGTLTETVRQGKPIVYQDLSEKSDEWLESYVDSLHWRASMIAPDVISLINLTNVNRVLDLGGGSGLYAMEFINAKPGVKATVFDIPQLLKHAEKHIIREGHQDDIKLMPGDFLKDDYGSGYDLVFISNVIHIFSIWDSIKILQKVYDSLNKGGVVIIEEELLSDSRTSPEQASILSVNMLVNTKGGDALTETDVWIMMREAWFNDIQRRNTDFGTALMIGKRR